MFVVNIFYILAYFNEIQNPLITLKATLAHFNHILPAFGIAREYSTEIHCCKEMVLYIFIYVCGN